MENPLKSPSLQPEFNVAESNEFSAMKNEILKNREGRIVARVKGEWLLGRSGLPVARYVKAVDKTLTPEGRVVGNGDQRLRKLGDK
jgi:hypothetical protein